MLRTRRRSFSIAFLAGLASCVDGSSGAPPPRVTRADSAGIEIVTTETAAADVPVFATLDSTPGLRLGAVDGPTEEQFGSVRDLAPLSDGGVAVLDGQAAEIRMFAADGTFRKTVAKRGEGPGELSFPSAVASLAGDTLAVFDSRSARLTRFAPDGTLGRVETLQTEGYALPYVASLFADGGVVGQLRWSELGNSFPQTPEGKQTLAVDSAALVVYTPDGRLSDTVAVLPSFEGIRTMNHSGNSVFIRMASTAFDRSLVFAAHPDGVWAGFGDHFALRLMDPADGHVKRILRAPGLERPLTDAEAKAILDEAMADADTPDERRSQQEWYDLSPRPEMRPTYDRLVVDDAARLWLREWAGGNQGGSRWWVFARDGGLLGSVDTPEHFSLMAVQGDQAWGVTHDDLDVSYVVRYRVSPRSAS
jgi:hypothetical protein